MYRRPQSDPWESNHSDSPLRKFNWCRGQVLQCLGQVFVAVPAVIHVVLDGGRRQAAASVERQSPGDTTVKRVRPHAPQRRRLAVSRWSCVQTFGTCHPHVHPADPDSRLQSPMMGAAAAAAAAVASTGLGVTPNNVSGVRIIWPQIWSDRVGPCVRCER